MPILITEKAQAFKNLYQSKRTANRIQRERIAVKILSQEKENFEDHIDPLEEELNKLNSQ